MAGPKIDKYKMPKCDPDMEEPDFEDDASTVRYNTQQSNNNLSLVAEPNKLMIIEETRHENNDEINEDNIKVLVDNSNEVGYIDSEIKMVKEMVNQSEEIVNTPASTFSRPAKLSYEYEVINDFQLHCLMDFKKVKTGDGVK